VRLKNAVGEIAECIALKKMIQYRIVNDDLERASNAFLKLIETLYQHELLAE
jgi:guanylate kinase